MKSLFLLLVLSLSSSLFARMREDEPWFSGPIIAFYPRNTPKGRTAIEPYLYAGKEFGVYNKNSSLIKTPSIHKTQVEIELKGGITKKIDYQAETHLFHVSTRGDEAYLLGDTSVYLGFQLLEDRRDTATPDLRFMLGETFPTGKYQNLNPLLQGGDGVGLGAFQTSLIVIGRKIFYHPCHPSNITFNLIQTLASTTTLKGLNSYTSIPLSSTKLSPGPLLAIDLAFESKINRHFGWIIEAYYTHQVSSPLYQENLPIEAAPSSESLSLLPSLEYAFNPNFSCVLGWWFTVYGRNSTAFSTFASYLYYQF